MILLHFNVNCKELEGKKKKLHYKVEAPHQKKIIFDKIVGRINKGRAHKTKTRKLKLWNTEEKHNSKPENKRSNKTHTHKKEMRVKSYTVGSDLHHLITYIIKKRQRWKRPEERGGFDFQLWARGRAEKTRQSKSRAVNTRWIAVK